MEMMIKLEEGIIALTNELKKLREENASLRKELGNSQSLQEQNYNLEALLQKEKEVKHDANAAIERLLKLIQEEITL